MTARWPRPSATATAYPRDACVHQLRDEVRTWLRANLPWEYGVGLPPKHDDLADEVAFGREWQAKLADGRWVGVTWPAEYGGQGLPVSLSVCVLESLGAANMAFCTLCAARPSSVAGIRCVHSSGICPPLSYSAIICPLTPSSRAQARPPARICSRTSV